MFVFLFSGQPFRKLFFYDLHILLKKIKIGGFSKKKKAVGLLNRITKLLDDRKWKKKPSSLKYWKTKF